MTKKEIGIIEEFYHYAFDMWMSSDEGSTDREFYRRLMDILDDLEDSLGIDPSEYWLRQEE